jgi:gamma-glutamyltranspeptidase/glutathione hydrolase
VTRVAVAASSRLAADAGAEMGTRGGNAVDAAVAASLVQLVTEPGVVSVGAGAFLVLREPGGAPVMVDGASEMPGRSAAPERFGAGAEEVLLPYGGGTPTAVGPGTVATPGALAAYALAAERYGRLPWVALLGPAERAARDGFPMPPASYHYLAQTREQLFGWNPAASAPLLDRDGAVLRTGERVVLADLADSLAMLARDGVDAFYRGELAERIVAEVQGRGGLLGRDDLEAYEARIVPALEVPLDAWRLATAPAPSVGGAVLAAMLLQLRGIGSGTWTPAMRRRLADAQAAVLRYRTERLDVSADLDGDAAELLRRAASGGPGPGGAPGDFPGSGLGSPSTVHASAVDDTGLACAITASAGYGSGVLPPGTGIWLNNSLGEAELNRRGFHALAPGTRVPSNMAPTVGWMAGAGGGPDREVLAIGSPGADRITTAILQTLVNFVHLRMPLDRAVDHPRLHVEWPAPGQPRVAHEPGMGLEGGDVPQRPFEDLHMFFGGVAAVHFAAPDRFQLAADARRTGGTALAGSSSPPR